jgi:hypothetical protein
LFAAGPILARLVVGAGPGPAVLFAAVRPSIGVLMGMNFPFALYALAGSSRHLRHKRLGSRSVLFTLGGIVAAANVAAVAVSHALAAESASIAADTASAAIGGLVVAALVAFLLPVFENIFHVTTDIRLLELSNQNLPLLHPRVQAPGTISINSWSAIWPRRRRIRRENRCSRGSAPCTTSGRPRCRITSSRIAGGFNRHDRLEPSMTLSSSRRT